MNKSVLLYLFLVFISCNSEHNITVATEYAIPDPASPIQENYVLKIKIFSNDTLKSKIKMTGFGYDIYRNNALYIHQPNIPAVAGNGGFSTAENAQKAANLVAYKIQNNILPPSISTQELDSLGLLK